MPGRGPALFEARLGEAGQLLNPGLIDYRLPTVADFPDELDTILIENADGPGPFGSKGVGQSGIFCGQRRSAGPSRRALREVSPP